MKKFNFFGLNKKEIILWLVSIVIVGAANIIGGAEPVNLSATLIGVTALIFLARGDVRGQILTVIFSLLYAVTSFRFHYYGEMITYLGMTMPIAAFSVYTWKKNPYKENEVKIHKLTFKQKVVMICLTIIVTIIFYYILKALNTNNLVISTVSIATSFLASYLSLYRSSYYAVAYAVNDIVLIVMWILATVNQIVYLPMIACFTMFLINDLYGFVCWKKREMTQNIK